MQNYTFTNWQQKVWIPRMKLEFIDRVTVADVMLQVG